MLTGLAYPMTHVDGDTLLAELLYEQEARLDEGQLLAGVNKVLSRTVRAGDDAQPMLLASYGHPRIQQGSISARPGGSRRHGGFWIGARRS
jgi:hypothetical protein